VELPKNIAQHLATEQLEVTKTFWDFLLTTLLANVKFPFVKKRVERRRRATWYRNVGWSSPSYSA
jgi:hypothetical protein